MKFVWTAFIYFIVLCNKVKTIPSTASNVVNKTLTLPKGKSVILQTIQQHETLPSHSAQLELTTKNRLMPQIQIIHTTVKNNNNSKFESTTRRPLMKNRKFTSKPHSIHYIHSRTHGEQSNFSKRRNFNGKKRFRFQNNTKNTPNTSEDTSSVEDRFKNFTDVDDIGELIEDKRKVFPNRQFKRRRGYLATAASEQFKSVALYTLQNTNKYRSKSKSAINESLQKIKTIRPGMKGMSITTKTVPTKVNENMRNSQIKNTLENKTVTTSEKFVHGEIITEKFVHLTTIADEVIYLPITTEKSILSSATTRNIQEMLNKSETSIESADKIKISSKSDSGTIKSLPLIIVTGKSFSLSDMHKAVETITDRKFVSTEKTPLITTTKKLDSTETISEMIESSEAKTENSENFAAMIEKSVDSVIEKHNSDKLVIKKDKNLVTLDHYVNQTRKPVDLTITTYKPTSDDELTKKTQKSVDSAIATETSAISLIITENPADTIEVSEKSDLETVKSVPLSIVTGKSISLSDMNNTIIEAITDSNIVMPKDIFNPKIRDFEENIITLTPTSNEEQITTTERDRKHLAMRRKRRINIIEEERIATKSTGISFSERETHIGADLTYRNIHT